MDTCYPWNRGRGYPRCLIIGLPTRFPAAKFPLGAGHGPIISEILSVWAQWVGFAKRILVGAGGVFDGSTSPDPPNAYGCLAIASHVGDSCQTCKVERIARPINMSFRETQGFNLSGSPRRSKLALSVSARNITPCSGDTIFPVAALSQAEMSFREDFRELP